MAPYCVTVANYECPPFYGGQNVMFYLSNSYVISSQKIPDISDMVRLIRFALRQAQGLLICSPLRGITSLKAQISLL